MMWQKEKFCSIRRVGQRFQRQWRAPSAESFDLSGNEFRAKGCNTAPEMVAPPPCLPSVVPHKLPFTELNASICFLLRHPPHLSCHFISVNKGGE